MTATLQKFRSKTETDAADVYERAKMCYLNSRAGPTSAVLPAPSVQSPPIHTNKPSSGLFYNASWRAGDWSARWRQSTAQRAATGKRNWRENKKKDASGVLERKKLCATLIYTSRISEVWITSKPKIYTVPCDSEQNLVGGDHDTPHVRNNHRHNLKHPKFHAQHQATVLFASKNEDI